MSLRFPLVNWFFNGRTSSTTVRRRVRPRHSIGLNPAGFRLEDRRMLCADCLPECDGGCNADCDNDGDGHCDTAYVASDNTQSNTAPMASGFDFLTMTEDSMSEPIDLNLGFSDAEDMNEQLTYSLVDAGDTDLIAAVSIDPTGQMVIAPVGDAFGFGAITVRCTDSGGLSTDAVFTFEIVGVNDPPVVESFGARFVAGAWEVFGSVTDVDGSAEGFVVEFGGDVGVHFNAAEVQADGTFVARQISYQPINGFITAETSDQDGEFSNIAETFIDS